MAKLDVLRIPSKFWKDLSNEGVKGLRVASLLWLCMESGLVKDRYVVFCTPDFSVKLEFSPKLFGFSSLQQVKCASAASSLYIRLSTVEGANFNNFYFYTIALVCLYRNFPQNFLTFYALFRKQSRYGGWLFGY